MEKERKTSGLEKVPRILDRPVWKDRVFQAGILTAIFWGALFWWLFF